MAGMNRNHTYQDISFSLGETWTIKGTLNKDNAPLPIDSQTLVCFKLANARGIVLNLSLSNDIAITDQNTAAYCIVIQPSQQSNTPSLVPGLYRYELSAKLSDNSISIQAEGSCALNTSLSYQYKS